MVPKIICQAAIMAGASLIARRFKRTFENAAPAPPNEIPNPPRKRGVRRAK